MNAQSRMTASITDRGQGRNIQTRGPHSVPIACLFVLCVCVSFGPEGGNGQDTCLPAWIPLSICSCSCSSREDPPVEEEQQHRRDHPQQVDGDHGQQEEEEAPLASVAPAPGPAPGPGPARQVREAAEVGVAAGDQRGQEGGGGGALKEGGRRKLTQPTDEKR